MLATTKEQSYDDTKDDEANRKSLVFEHQLSYISFQAKSEDIAALTNVKINYIEVTVPYTKGSIAFTNNTTAPLTKTAGTYVYKPLAAQTDALSTSDWTDCGYFLAIPQDITVTGAKAKIQYQYKVGSKTYTKTVDNLSLASKDPTPWTSTDWAKSTHYTYNITIGLREILFTVSVDNNWVNAGAKEIY